MGPEDLGAGLGGHARGGVGAVRVDHHDLVHERAPTHPLRPHGRDDRAHGSRDVPRRQGYRDARALCALSGEELVGVELRAREGPAPEPLLALHLARAPRCRRAEGARRRVMPLEGYGACSPPTRARRLS